MNKYSDKTFLLQQWANDISPAVEFLSSLVLSKKDFQQWSGSGKPEHHHYGDGGLQFHTWEVVKLALDNARFSESIGQAVNQEVLFLACVYHDVGKIWDYRRTDWGWERAPHARLIHHISRSCMIWAETIAQFPQYHRFKDAVAHCIISHHGLREWGSPVAPSSREAWILHLSDALSARMNDCERLDVTKL